MSRYLFVVPPLAAHVNPAVAVVQALRDRGHEVAWVGSERYFRPHVGPDAVLYATGMRPYRGQRDEGMRAVKSLWEDFVIPFARAIAPAVDVAIADYRPDVVVVDQHAIAGAFAAHRHGLPWASLAPTQMELARPFQSLPKVEQWIESLLSRFGEPIDPRTSPYLVIAFTTAALTGAEAYPQHYAAVGPAVAVRPGVPDFPWSMVDSSRQLVLVTAGTNASDLARSFLRRVVAGLEPLAGKVQAVVHGAPAAVPEPPEHILVVPRIPVLDLLPMVDGMVCHGGMGTTSEALLYGIPLVVTPIRYDHPIVAAQVVAAGAGLRLHFARATPDELTMAIGAILDDPGYRSAARHIGGSFAAAGGARAAADRLERLA